MASLTQECDDLRPDAPGSADDDVKKGIGSPRLLSTPDALTLSERPESLRPFAGSWISRRSSHELPPRGPRLHRRLHAPTTDHSAGFRAQCPANAATTGASVSAEPAPKTK